MKILHLPLKANWFQMILSGEKKEEYREIKPYWISRLVDEIHAEENERYGSFWWKGFLWTMDTPIYYDTIRFTNGYGADKPTFDIECKGISIGDGKPEWGFEKTCFIIKLGDIISTNNINY